MSLFDQQNSDAGEAGKSKTIDYKYAYVVFLIILLPVFLFFQHIGHEDMGLNIDVCLGMCIIAIRTRWDLRRQPWFWGVIAFVLALHVPLFLMIQWPHAWVPGFALLPVGLADMMIILGAVRLVEKFIVKPSASA
jgi:hypothetical protein